MVSRSSSGIRRDTPSRRAPARAPAARANSRRRSCCISRERLVFQKPGRAERLDQVLLHLAHFQSPVMPHQRRAQIQVRLRPVEALQALHQRRRNDQHGVGEAVRVADEQPRMFRRGRRHEIQVQAQARQ